MLLPSLQGLIVLILRFETWLCSKKLGPAENVPNPAAGAQLNFQGSNSFEMGMVFGAGGRAFAPENPRDDPVTPLEN